MYNKLLGSFRNSCDVFNFNLKLDWSESDCDANDSLPSFMLKALFGVKSNSRWPDMLYSFIFDLWSWLGQMHYDIGPCDSAGLKFWKDKTCCFITDSDVTSQKQKLIDDLTHIFYEQFHHWSWWWWWSRGEWWVRSWVGLAETWGVTNIWIDYRQTDTWQIELFYTF